MDAEPAESTAPVGADPTHVFPAMPTEYERAGADWFSAALRELAAELHPMLKQVTRQPVDEMPDFTEQDSEPGGDSDYRQFAHTLEWTVPLDSALAFDVDATLVQLYTLADKVGGQQEVDMIRHMSDVAEATGNVVTMSPGDFVESFIASLDTLQIDFNEDGQHNVALYLTPELFRQLQKNPPTPQQQARIDAIMTMKREEHRADRGHRRLS